MSFPRYPDYKDSGVEWLGDVPVHWEVAPPKWHMRSASGSNAIKGQCADEPSEDLYPGFSASGQDVWLTSYDFDFPGIVLSAVGARCGKTFKANGAWGVVANTHCLFPNDNSDRNYLWYLTNQEDWWEKGGSAQPFVKVSDTLARKWVFPPLPEQTQIAAFLDRETAKIDGLVAEQRRLMTLLKEKRQAVISHAVTQGLNPDAPMKSSSIEWLGQVPAHWRVVSLGRVTVSRCDGPFGSGLKSEHYTDSGVRVIRLQNIRRDGFNGSDEAFIDAEYYKSELSGHDVVSGDVLIAGLGDDKNTVGRACVAPVGIEPAMVKADCFRYRLDITQALPEFVATALSASSASDAGVLSSGSTRSRIPLSVMATRKLAMPPLIEQLEIAAFLKVTSAGFDTLTTEAQRAIALLQERRTALISAAVTGQIDVRSADLEELA